MCCSPWGCRESGTTERLNNNKGREIHYFRENTELLIIRLSQQIAKSRLLSQTAGSPLFSDRRAGLPGTTSQACAGGPRGTDPWLESMRWVGVAGSRALFVWSHCRRRDHLTSHAQRGKEKNCSWKKMFFRFKQSKSFCKKTPLRDFPKFTQTQMHWVTQEKKAGVGVWMDEDSRMFVASRSRQVGMPGLLRGPGGVYPPPLTDRVMRLLQVLFPTLCSCRSSRCVWASCLPLLSHPVSWAPPPDLCFICWGSQDYLRLQSSHHVNVIWKGLINFLCVTVSNDPTTDSWSKKVCYPYILQIAIGIGGTQGGKTYCIVFNSHLILVWPLQPTFQIIRAYLRVVLLSLFSVESLMETAFLESWFFSLSSLGEKTGKTLSGFPFSVNLEPINESWPSGCYWIFIDRKLFPGNQTFFIKINVICYKCNHSFVFIIISYISH